MSNVLKYIRRALTPIVMVMATQTLAASIKIVGPDGEQKAEQPTSPTQVVNPARVTPSTVSSGIQATTRVYGPTSTTDTLWSIATRLRPSANTSVQQTVLAIYKLNPQAFDDNNIHSLNSNSTLRIPTLAQVRNESQATAVRVLREHQALLDQANAPVVVATPVPVTPTIVERAAPESVAPVVKPKDVTPITPPTVDKSTVSDDDLVALKKELESNEVEYSALEESNHALRLKLANVQYEVEALKDAISDDDRIRDEVQKFIEEQKLALKEEEQPVETSLIDSIADSPTMVAALALIPGSMIAGLIAFLLFRRKKQVVEDEPEQQTVVEDEPIINMDDDIPELTLSDDDDDLDIDLESEGEAEEFEFDPNAAFGDDSDDPFASTEEAAFDDSTLEDEDPFAAVVDDALAEELLSEETEVTSNNFSVDAGVKALGLEEMERALDEIDSGLDTDDDTDEDFDLSLSSIEGIDDESGIDLSGEGEDDALSIDLSGEGESESIDLSGGEENDASISLDDESSDIEWDTPESEEDTFSLEATDEVEVNSDDLDFDTLLGSEQDSPVRSESESTEFDLDSDIHDDLFASAFTETSESSEEDSFELSADSTKLLDEVVEQSNEENSDSDLFEIDQQNTELLDELLAENGDESNKQEPEFEIEAESTELLDELLADTQVSDSEAEALNIEQQSDDDTFEIDEQSTDLLDELLAEPVENDSESEALNIETQSDDDTFEIDEQSTDLLDELLAEPEESDSESDLLNLEAQSDEEALNLDEQSTELLDELLAEPEESDSESDLLNLEAQSDEETVDVDEQSTGLLDELLAESEESDSEADLLNLEAESAEETVDVDEQSTDLLDELLTEPQESDSALETSSLQDTVSESSLGIDEQSAELLDELLTDDVESESDEVATLQEVIEESESEPQAEPAQLNEDQPRDEDWLVDADEEVIEAEEASMDGLSVDEALAELEDDQDIEDRTQLFNELDFPVYGEDEALADAQIDSDLVSSEEPEVKSDQPFVISDSELGQFGEEEAKSDVGLTASDVGDDWSGFKFQSENVTDDGHEIPADESGAWGTEPTPEPEIEQEDWSNQPEFENSVQDESKFISIDTLIAQSESGELKEVDEQRDLNVGLNEFPDVIGDVDDFDVDIDKESQSKLDLAKAYLEMSDSDGARELLEDVLSSSDEKLKTEATLLLKMIAK
ncbi:FimV/HubP family polar landmark protein [Aliivibrio kagoshimensis]|uniref:FimV/HubP family polar landmark protein n=1 Tax=Aliivibrio kagoshimensis TaxID=2910230 RepID=UPI003D149580